MRSLFRLVCWTLLLGLCGCGDTPYGRPTPGNEAVLQPLFHFRDGQQAASGLGFAVQDIDGHVYAIFSTSVLESTDWERLNTISLLSLNGRVVVPNLNPSKLDLQYDLLALLLPSGSGTTLSRLARADAEKGDYLWIAGQTPHSLGQRLYRTKVQTSEAGKLQLTREDALEGTNLDGAPIYNERNELAGIVRGQLPVNQAPVQAESISIVRARLAQAGVVPR